MKWAHSQAAESLMTVFPSCKLELGSIKVEPWFGGYQDKDNQWELDFFHAHPWGWWRKFEDSLKQLPALESFK